MNDIMVFENQQFGRVRTVNVNNEPWFVAVDLCKVLGIRSDTVRKILDDDEVKTVNHNTIGVLKGRDPLIVCEPGLYRLILKSRKNVAKAFQRWITHEVIPAIRKTGGYINGEEHMEDDELMAKALIVANNKLKLREDRIRQLEAEAKENAPKIALANAITASKDSILIGELARYLKQRGMDIGQQRLYKRLRDEGFLCSRFGDQYNLPTQRAMEMKLFEVRERAVVVNGEVKLKRTTRVLPKGQMYFMNRFLGT